MTGKDTTTPENYWTHTKPPSALERRIGGSIEEAFKATRNRLRALEEATVFNSGEWLVFNTAYSEGVLFEMIASIEEALDVTEELCWSKLRPAEDEAEKGAEVAA